MSGLSLLDVSRPQVDQVPEGLPFRCLRCSKTPLRSLRVASGSRLRDQSKVLANGGYPSIRLKETGDYALRWNSGNTNPSPEVKLRGKAVSIVSNFQIKGY